MASGYVLSSSTEAERWTFGAGCRGQQRRGRCPGLSIHGMSVLLLLGLLALAPRPALSKAEVDVRQLIAEKIAAGTARDSDVALPPPELGLTLGQMHAQRVVKAMHEAAKVGLVWAPRAHYGGAPADPPVPGSVGLSNPTQAAAMQVATCINDKYVRKNVTWASAMADDLASVEVAGAWMTAKARDVPVTLVTQSTVDRIPQLYTQCKSWGGPMAVVLFLALEQQAAGPLSESNEALLQTAILHVSGFYDDIEHDATACKPDILLVYEVYRERRAMLLYPINLLRNLARLMARTPLVALVDVDMLLSSTIHQTFKDAAYSQKIVEEARDKVAYVLPAFETYGMHHEAAALADLLVSRDKPFLVDNVKRGIAGPFDSKRFVLGHQCTDFNRWYTSDKDYFITYGERYEPWVIVDRFAAPWHDVRFRGYGNNKIQHIAHINATAFKFKVLSNAFIIHRAHKETSVRHRLVASKVAYDTAKALKQPVDTSSVYGHTKTMFDNAKDLMMKGQFVATVDPATTNCRDTLLWWKTTGELAQMRQMSERASSTARLLGEGEGGDVINAQAVGATGTSSSLVRSGIRRTQRRLRVGRINRPWSK